MITNVKTEAEFQNIIDMNNGVVVVKFGAPWCNPCKVIDKTLEEIDNEGVNAVIIKVNVDDLPQIASEFRIMSVPTTFFLKNKEAKTMLNGASSKETIVDLINEINIED